MAQWKKVLYAKQKHPDNYVDPSFLSELRKNVNLYNFSLFEAVIGVCSLTHEVCSTVLFFIVFLFLKDDIYPLPTVTFHITGLICLCSLIHVLTCNDRNSFKTWAVASFKNFGNYVLFMIIGYLFSPIIQVLTETISTDTIYAMVTLMLITHIVFQNYGVEGPIVSPSLSLNSALFAAVCLSSRLSTVHHTFMLILSAVQIFVLLPILRQKMLKNHIGLAAMTTVFAVVTVGTLYFYISEICGLLLLLLCLFLNFACPFTFVYCQKYKETIFGPWDEAILKEGPINGDT